MTLLAVLAHPDDESMGTAGLLWRHAAAGVEVHLVCATRGGAGWQGKPPGAKRGDLPRIRTAELEAASQVLGLRSLQIWDYPDGGVEESDQAEITERISAVIASLRPRVVVGWGPDGGYGHPDHIVVGRCTDAAVAAVEASQRPALYHLAFDEALDSAYRDVLALVGGGEEALPVLVIPDVDPVLDLIPEELEVKVKAVDCHQSQLEDWRIAIKERPDLLARCYGHEPYIAVSGASPRLGGRGLLAELS
jgi:LmbE family N-acetylglucosaminyl deacetylase